MRDYLIIGGMAAVTVALLVAAAMAYVQPPTGAPARPVPTAGAATATATSAPAAAATPLVAPTATPPAWVVNGEYPPVNPRYPTNRFSTVTVACWPTEEETRAFRRYTDMMQAAYRVVFPRPTTNTFALRAIERALSGDPCRGPYYQISTPEEALAFFRHLRNLYPPPPG
jgi:hypothetical protein